jgi:hypothetical protein
MMHDERTHHLRPAERIRKIRPCVVIAAGALQLFLIIESRADKSDPYHCLATRTLDQEPRTEMLPKGSCPIRLGQSCYDRSYGLEVSNKCPLPIRIHVDGGALGKPGSVTGDYTIDSGGKRQFRCLEAKGGCKGITAEVVEISTSASSQNKSPVAQIANSGDTPIVGFIFEGTELPNNTGAPISTTSKMANGSSCGQRRSLRFPTT